MARPSNPNRLIAVVVDDPGGPQDRIAADPDVATFLNDRFHALFFDPSAVQGLSPTPALLFFDPQGCLLSEVHQPADPASWITTANATLLAIEQGTATRAALPDVTWPAGLAADHPLRANCPSHTNTP